VERLQTVSMRSSASRNSATVNGFMSRGISSNFPSGISLPVMNAKGMCRSQRICATGKALSRRSSMSSSAPSSADVEAMAAASAKVLAGTRVHGP
jgi:hypothetical protein